MNDSITRRGFLAIAGATSFAGCSAVIGDRPPEPDRSPTNSRARSLPPLADQPLLLPLTPSQLHKQAVSGGVSKGGIPAIDEPKFESADQANERFSPEDVVFGVAQNGIAKAYPQSILVWHEICNDTIDDTPVSITYCPLTGTAIGFERGKTAFGVSGRLVNNNLIMYDRATEHWWPQVLATAIPGWDAEGRSTAGNRTESTPTGSVIGRTLREFRVMWTTWGQWQDQFPDTRVLTEDTGYIRDYGRDPYGSYNPRNGYYAPQTEPLFAPLDTNGPLDPNKRYPPKTGVVGARTSDGALAFHKPSLNHKKVMKGKLNGIPHVGVYDKRLDTGYVYRNSDKVSVTPATNGVRVTSTVHPPDKLPLKRIHAFEAMWFAWNGFYPTSSVYE
jgi:hypothetical protein